jgi:hypothetical protein
VSHWRMMAAMAARVLVVMVARMSACRVSWV